MFLCLRLCVCGTFCNNFPVVSQLMNRYFQIFYVTIWYLTVWIKVKKIKYTLVQALRLCTGRTAHRGSRGIALLFHDHGTRRGWGVSVTSRPLFTSGKDPVPIVREAEWAPGPVWTSAENLTPTGIRSPDRTARPTTLPGHQPFEC